MTSPLERFTPLMESAQQALEAAGVSTQMAQKFLRTTVWTHITMLIQHTAMRQDEIPKNVESDYLRTFLALVQDGQSLAPWLSKNRGMVEACA